MAWDDDKKPNDPWGQAGDQGPPDLDETFRKLKGALGSLFGGGGSSGGNSSGSSGKGRFFSPTWIGGIVVVVLLIYLAFGIYQIDAQERGVVFLFGKVQDDVKQPGLNFLLPGVYSLERVNVTRVNSSAHEGQMLTEDENIVKISLVVQFIVEDPISHLVQIRTPTESLKQATESALRHVVGSSTMDSVITEGREIFGTEVQARLQEYLDRYQTGIRVSKVNIDFVGPPAEVQDAFDDVQKAKEDEVRFTNNATAYAEQIVPEARGIAQQAIEEANAYRDQVIASAEGEAERFSKLLAQYQISPAVTRDRLYIEALETVMSATSKVVVDVEGGNNLMYLPLDQLQRQAAGAIVNSRTSSDSLVDEAADRVLERLQSRTPTINR